MEKFEGKPFVFLGVNGDPDRVVARGYQDKYQLNWRSFWDAGDNGKISKAYGIEGWPTTFVIDARGVIRHSGHDVPGAERAIEKLLRGMDAGKKS